MINLNIPNKLPPMVKWQALTQIILFFFLVSFPFLIVGGGKWFIGLFLFLCGFIGLPFFIYIILYYNYLNFVIENDKITINSGIIIKHSKSISFDKIQNVENIRGILNRIFGLSKVNIWTSSPEQIKAYKGSTTHKPDGSLDLLVEDGEWLKNFILSKRS